MYVITELSTNTVYGLITLCKLNYHDC